MHLRLCAEREKIFETQAKKMATFVQKPTTTNCYNNCHLLNLFFATSFRKKYKYASLGVCVCLCVPKNTKEYAVKAKFTLMSFAFHFKNNPGFLNILKRFAFFSVLTF